jgi:hypothetical protein
MALFHYRHRNLLLEKALDKVAGLELEYVVHHNLLPNLWQRGTVWVVCSMPGRTNLRSAEVSDELTKNGLSQFQLVPRRARLTLVVDRVYFQFARDH